MSLINEDNFEVEGHHVVQFIFTYILKSFTSGRSLFDLVTKMGFQIAASKVAEQKHQFDNSPKRPSRRITSGWKLIIDHCLNSFVLAYPIKQEPGY